ncbi:MAG: hypothetical protein ACD_77C00419G0001 [uncultured bacterium]|nr:MAG: hypothetical protein ACD_77C00419G0001 [uncultured bacterium]
MDVDMFLHIATQKNIDTLARCGVEIIDPNAGELASGLEGKGRMAEPDEIVLFLEELFGSKESLKGKKVLINAGPTREAIDPVRFISNHSTGKMGYAIAAEFAGRGAQVTLVSGPVNILLNNPGIKVEHVTTAEEMYKKTLECYEEGADITILSAAVADFTPVLAHKTKIKREKVNYNIELKPTKDISAEIGKHKRKGSLLIGFALETNNEASNAESKLKKKGLDAIVLNSLNDSGAGFGVDTNKISIIAKGGEITHYPLKSKELVARDIADYIENLLVCLKA